jgi:3-oxoacyl-[acyl-carrier-protein] synthase II
MNQSNGNRSRRRVVVTGLGAVSPNGVGIENFWQATRSGISGVDTISRFDPTPLPCRIAGEIKNFHAEEFLTSKEIKRTARAVPLAIAATKEAFCRAKVNLAAMNLEDKRSWGVILGSGGGAPDFIEEQKVRYVVD